MFLIQGRLPGLQKGEVKECRFDKLLLYFDSLAMPCKTVRE